MSDPAGSPGLSRKVGLFQATAINMSQMCGIGPFVTIPLMVAAFGGPQAVIGWIAGAILALADGLIWAELGASLPGSGGTYVYLREAFQYRSGKLMPFLFVWTAMLFIPLIMSTGVQGLVQYLGYLFPKLTTGQGDIVGVGVVALVILLLWRKIENIGKVTVVMWAVMIVSVAAVILASFTHFHPSLAFTWPAHAIQLTHGQFWIGFASGLTIGIYDYLGYNTTAYMGAEIKSPGRVMPRSIIWSIVAIMAIYLLLQIGVLGVVPWHDMLDPNNVASQSVASAVLEKTFGKTTADVVTWLILITAFASVFTGLLGGSRVPYDAARDKVFFKSFGRLHPKHQFPVLGLLTMGVVTAAGFLFARHIGNTATHPPLTILITLLTTVMVIIQALAQIAAVTVLRKRQPGLARPYKMLLYPLPSVVAGIGWLVIYGYADKANPGVHPIEWSIGWVVLGVVAYLIWSRVEKVWPFGPKEIREQYLEEQRATELADSAA
ncbi:APC family permease [Streptacidiphilus jiangxiensis]|uniref:Amino acid transporter n=1 Tax=Streptacidiphilus jiangxiensis TaxID=235985 RepID=A0A1H7TMX8_STRJI|nr:APC family permease [Streptacidiphilus jiangxiensis]SEL85804.1 Amino acid transporter [Streptacidiphilus jiangxiensis]